MGISFKRILLKLSGEILLGSQSFGVNPEACLKIAGDLKRLQAMGLEIAVVIGGGNIFRGIKLKSLGLERTPADHMGMLATIMNGIALQQALTALQCPSKVLSALECPKAVETYHWAKAQEYLSDGKIMIFVGGTGNPYFTTDSAAALRACEIKADLLLKATKVDGIYDKDPLKYADAQQYDSMTYAQFLAQKLQVMDATAVTLCMGNQIPIFVFNMSHLGTMKIDELMPQPKYGTIVNSR